MSGRWLKSRNSLGKGGEKKSALCAYSGVGFKTKNPCLAVKSIGQWAEYEKDCTQPNANMTRIEGNALIAPLSAVPTDCDITRADACDERKKKG